MAINLGGIALTHQQNTADAPRGKPRPPMFRALGRGEPPMEIELDDSQYRLVKVYKHDSWAASALYEGPSDQVVCKFNRQQSMLGIPMRWLGHMLARREAAMLRCLSDVPLVPNDSGAVRVNGRVLNHAVAHAYVPGRSLRDGDQVNDLFFPRLTTVIQTLHQRGIAYVDLHKRENVILDDNGRPHLIDFQISLRLPHVWPLTWVTALFCASDRYHLAKHIVKMRPDQCDDATKRLVTHRPWWIRAHRYVAVPFRESRRRLLVLLGIRRGRGMVATEHFAEEGAHPVTCRRRPKAA